MINTIDIFRFLEKKDHIIKKLPITDEQKIEAIDFFTTHPSYESEIDWNRKDLTWEDLEKVINKSRNTKSQIKKAVKQGIVGLTEGIDYVYVGTKDYQGSPVYAYIPLNWKGSRVLASDQVEPKLSTVFDGYTGAKWCISYQKTDQYWLKYQGSSCFIFLFGETVPTKKIALQITKRLLYREGPSNFDISSIEIWDAQDTPISIEDLGYSAQHDMLDFIKNFVYKAPIIKDSLITLDDLSKEGKLGLRVIDFDDFEEWYSQYKNPDGTISVYGDLNISYLNEEFFAEVSDNKTVELAIPYDNDTLNTIQKYNIKYKEVTGDVEITGNSNSYSISDVGSFEECNLGGSFLLDCYNLKSFDGMPKYFGSQATEDTGYCCCGITYIKENSPIKNLKGVPAVHPDMGAKIATYSIEECPGLESFDGIPNSELPIKILYTFIDSSSYNLRTLGSLPKGCKEIFLESFLTFDSNGNPAYSKFEGFEGLDSIETSEESPLEIIVSCDNSEYNSYTNEIQNKITQKIISWLNTIPKNVYVRFKVGFHYIPKTNTNVINITDRLDYIVAKNTINAAFQRVSNAFFSDKQHYNPNISFTFSSN